MQELPIADYALLGDTRTAALVSSSGSIDWMCVPTFEGQPIFGRLISGEGSGSFVMGAKGVKVTKRRYLPGSAVLHTDIETDTGTGSKMEGMVVDVGREVLPQMLMVRHVTCERGTLPMQVRFDPRLGLPGDPPKSSRRIGATVCTWGSLAVAFHSGPDLHIDAGQEREIELSAGSSLTCVLSLSDREPAVIVPPRRALELLHETDRWWRRWTDDVGPEWPFRDAVVRSLITLRLLTFAPSGAPVASPTTSLPEHVGGERNWDYRFSWIRDASIGIGAFLAVGKTAMAKDYLHWLLHASRLSRPRLKVLYTIYGTPSHDEQELQEIPGYRGSRPVRTGNSASAQHQIDAYGWVLHAAWMMVHSGQSLQGEAWRALSGFADQLTKVWSEPDSGIWEIPGERRHYVHSKLMAWAGLGCALKIAEHHRTTGRRQERWTDAREAISSDIREQGFHPELGGYAQYYGSAEPDASLLLLSILGFPDGDDRVIGSLEAVRRTLEVKDGLVYRYRPGTDGLPGREGAFLPCSFWLGEALAVDGSHAAAVQVFERALGYANDLGLFSEEADPQTGDLLGNFPLCFTHSTLIHAAAALKETGAA